MTLTIPEFKEYQKKGKVRKKPAHGESNLQQSCVRWFRLQYPQWKYLLFSIPNGGKRGIITATIMKREGCLKGVPDLFFAYPINTGSRSSGLFIEMKKENGKLSEDQLTMFRELNFQGYTCKVCRSLDEFKSIIENYLK